MINSSQRFDAYKVFMKYLYHHGMVTFGAGLGSLRVYAPTVQSESGFMVTFNESGLKGWIWQWLHSDFLQSWFELGVIGFLLVLLIYIHSIIIAYRRGDQELFSLGLGLGIAAAVNYPCRYFSTAFLVVYFLVQSLRLDESNRAGNQDPVNTLRSLLLKL
jgi:O-antigen ligase